MSNGNLEREMSKHEVEPGVLDPAVIEQLNQDYGLEEALIMKCWSGFLHFDEDGSGIIEKKEMMVLLKHLGEDVEGPDLAKLLKKFDPDGNGEMDFVEFVECFIGAPGQRAQVLEHQIDQLSSKVRGEFRDQQLSLEEKVKRDGVSSKFVQSYLRKELNEAGACLELPAALLYFMLFLMSVYLHKQVHILHSVDSAINFDITENANFAFSGIIPYENGRMGHKNVNDVNNIPDFWSWFSMGLVPLLWVEAWDLSEARSNTLAMCTSDTDNLKAWGWTGDLSDQRPPLLPNCPESSAPDLPPTLFGKDPRGMYIYYQRIIGGIRVRQERYPEKPCLGSESTITSSYGATCYDGDYVLEPELHAGMAFNEALGDGMAFFLKKNLGQGEIRAILREKEDQHWLSPATQKIEINMAVYNGALDMVTVTWINFFFARDGHIYKSIESVSLWMNNYQNPLLYAVDGLWVFMTLRMFLTEGWDVGRHWFQLGFCKGTVVYAGFWNGVDWAAIIFSFWTFFQWWTLLQMLSELSEYMAEARLDVVGSWADDNKLSAFTDKYVETAKFSNYFSKLTALYPFIIVFRLFKAYHAQPRLAVVTRTLQDAFVDIYHFGIVFVSVLMAYCVSGIFLYADKLEEFAAIDRSLTSCWNLLLGDFEWERLRLTGRLEAGFWFWTFSIIVVQVMLNMLIAVIMDVYTQVKSSCTSAETLYSQSAEIWRRWRATRRKNNPEIALDHILQVLDPTDLDDGAEDEPEEILTLHAFQKKFEYKLTEEQAMEILTSAAVGAESEDRAEQHLSMSNAVLKIQEMQERQEQIHYSLEQLVYLCNLIHDRMCGPTEEAAAIEHQPAKIAVEGADAVAVAFDTSQSKDSKESKPTPALVVPPANFASPELDGLLADLSKMTETVLAPSLERTVGTITAGCDSMVVQSAEVEGRMTTGLTRLDRRMEQLAEQVDQIKDIQQDLGDSSDTGRRASLAGRRSIMNSGPRASLLNGAPRGSVVASRASVIAADKRSSVAPRRFRRGSAVPGLLPEDTKPQGGICSTCVRAEVESRINSN